MAERYTHVSIGGDYKPGDPPPQGYTAWHEWAEVQANAGLVDVRCCICCKFKFPQELSPNGYGKSASPVCTACWERLGETWWHRPVRESKS
jgi:hypothetical protein